MNDLKTSIIERIFMKCQQMQKKYLVISFFKLIIFIAALIIATSPLKTVSAATLVDLAQQNSILMQKIKKIQSVVIEIDKNNTSSMVNIGSRCFSSGNTEEYGWVRDKFTILGQEMECDMKCRYVCSNGTFQLAEDKENACDPSTISNCSYVGGTDTGGNGGVGKITDGM